ncbi:NAD(P)-dependent glycerol-3-phosphate dehydrogenase [Rhodobacter sp. HX-7-19]|uniref:Glycerol-3-phosphate dehydrogenase [NAD(P)+] n=1 Tax=Paragemmobacter kunshanensis TaxID=2583234 RepID=A0A6M1U0W6_9RHOB|nr:NAD(P)H-dependent glycerol-3-phosphate dehydrogenase [Rhodobacter kunshanensis]NGQ89665.1 NAD(P)-dependent glycerol-3-phosphate dehydrogenase [Rhodobacter kunshanensis]
MIGIAGAGSFGTALAIALGREGRRVTLWARDPAQVAEMERTRRNEARLPGVDLPGNVTVTAEMGDLAAADMVLLSVPMQSLRPLLAGPGRQLNGLPLVACCKGIDLAALTGPSAILAACCPLSVAAILTGPSFAADIARGLPTALTLACADDAASERLQAALSTPVLRLYRSDDVLGAELGGALKNVIAIAAGVVIGAGLGDSARAALMTRGYAEMLRLATARGAKAETLAGLSGLGDLVLTCTSEQSRNFRFGLALGSGKGFDPSITVEGAATAKAVSDIAEKAGIDLPVTAMVAALIEGRLDLSTAMQTLLSRPLKKE